MQLRQARFEQHCARTAERIQNELSRPGQLWNCKEELGDVSQELGGISVEVVQSSVIAQMRDDLSEVDRDRAGFVRVPFSELIEYNGWVFYEAMSHGVRRS
ncbi:MAG: hypothetical protein MJE77_13620 [Proteobacteria bacterium]|nr:hypothetical protein [Pseudomonadota bacterium]